MAGRGKSAKKVKTDKAGAKSDKKPAAKSRKPSSKTASRSVARSAGRTQGKKQTMSDEEARTALAASDKLYYRIGEVSHLTGVKAHVLRYWETEFRWMAPPKSRAKQRLYRKRDIEFVWLLKHLLWDERFTIAGARQRIQDLGVDEAMRQALSPSASGDGADRVGTLDAAEGTTASDAVGPGETPVGDGVVQNPALALEDTSLIQAMLGDLRADLLGLRSDLQQGP